MIAFWWTVGVLTYLFIGGIINGLLSEENEGIEIAPLVVWPIPLMIIFGSEVGSWIKKYWKDIY